MAQAADFLFALRAQLKARPPSLNPNPNPNSTSNPDPDPHQAFMAEVKRALERSVSKDTKQEARRLEAQVVTFTQCRTLLHFIQVRRES